MTNEILVKINISYLELVPEVNIALTMCSNNREGQRLGFYLRWALMIITTEIRVRRHPGRCS